VYDNHTTAPESETPATSVRTLAELEEVVKTGLAKYHEVGNALDEIHARKLYKPQYKNFKTYLLERWGISRAHAYRLMNAAAIANCLPVGDRPETERQANQRTEKRSEKPKRSATNAAKPQTVSGLVNRRTLAEIAAATPDPEEVNVDKEFARFLSIIEDWELDLTLADYTDLLRRVESHVHGILTPKEEEVPA